MPASLVILPGLMCDSRMFQAQVRDFDAIVVDDFCGEADRITAMARYALRTLPERFSLMGHSMGALVALEIWRLEPERVERLALADTSGLPRDRVASDLGSGSRRWASGCRSIGPVI